MTEAEWLACADSQQMLYLVRGEASTRKLRLFSVACCRSIWPLLQDHRTQNAVEVAERFADGLASQREREEAAARAEDKACDNENDEPDMPSWAAFWAASSDVRHAADVSAFNASAEQYDQPEMRKQSHVLRDIFGNPFRPVAFSHNWRTDTVVALARLMYESRDFSSMPVLADALQDAGCDSADVLDHCRGPGPHVRGCWVVDLVLGKE